MAEKQDANKKSSRMSQADMPRVTLKEALALVYALRDDFASSDATPIDLALSVNRSPSSSAWRILTGAAVAYGLTTSAYNASEIALTPLGKRIAQPLDEGDDKVATAEAAQRPQVLKKFYDKYNRSRLPSEQIAKNQLNSMGVPMDRVAEAYGIAVSNAQYVGFITETAGNKYLQIKNTSSAPSALNPDEEIAQKHEGAVNVLDESTPAGDSPDDTRSLKPKPVFIAHGKDRAPLEQLTKILDQFKIPYRVAVAEPHAGRPVSQKVRDLMTECGSAIFIFSTSGENQNLSDEFVANLNVVFELGAASVLYGDKVIIFKENDLTLPSDFSDLGYISFEKEKLDAKAMDLLKELISMGFIQVVTAG